MKNYLLAFSLLFVFACGGDDDSATDMMPQGPPSSIFIERVQVDRWPSTQTNGDEWDQGAITGLGPDIYFAVNVSGTNDFVYIHNTADRFENPTPGSTLVWDNLNVELENPATVRYGLSLIDFDSLNDDDVMDGVSGFFYEEANGTPRQIVIDFGSSVAFTLDVRYQF